MTHGGLLGANEAVSCGVAVVVTPLSGDQFLNAAAMKSRGMGEVIYFEDITVESIHAGVRKALSLETQQNVEEVSYEFNNRLTTPSKTAVWWVEHVAKTKGAPLTKSCSVFLSGFVYYSLDIYAVIGIVFAASVYCWIVTLRAALSKRTTKQKMKLS